MCRLWPILACFMLSIVSTHGEEKLQLGEYLQQVESLNLDLKIEHAMVEGARANAIGVNIPAPMAGYIHSWEKGGASSRGFEVSQSLPFPTKIYSDRKVRKLEADSHAELHASKKAEILAQAKLAFITYWVASEKVQILETRKKNLFDHLKLARAGARSDSSMKVHLLRAESDIDLLENEIDEANQDLVERRNAIALHLGETNSASILFPAEPPLSEFKILQTESYQVRVAKAELNLSEAKAGGAYQSWLPDLSLKYKQMTGTPMTAGYSEIMVGASIPFVFPWEPYRQSRIATEERNQFQYRFQKANIELENSKNSLVSRAVSYKNQLQNIESKILPRAHKRMELLHGIAPRDMESLQDHREILENFSELRLKALNLRLDYERVAAELEKLYGVNHE